MSKKKKMTRFDLLALAEYEKIAEISYIQVSDSSKLRILQTSANSAIKDPYILVLIAGWGSNVLGWDIVLMEAKDQFDIVYIETREKGSSKIVKSAQFTLERFAYDIHDILVTLDIKQERVILLSTSFSSMLSAYLIQNKKINPFLSIFIGPIVKVPIPQSIKIMLAIFPKWLYPIVQKIGSWWAIRTAEDEEHAAKSARLVREADPGKWKKSTKPLTQKNFSDIYVGIENKVIVVDESEDKFHATESTQEISKSMKNSELLDLKTNKNTHSKPIIDLINQTISKMEK